MIRLNRTTEYGLMALRHISRKHAQDPNGVSSAREIASCYGLPFEITAKTLQRLKDSGLIQSAHGARGGYTLQRSLKEVSLAEFLELMEGPQAVVACATSRPGVSPAGSIGIQGGTQGGSEGRIEGESQVRECEYGARCEIHHVMGRLNARVFDFLSGIQLDDLAR